MAHKRHTYRRKRKARLTSEFVGLEVAKELALGTIEYLKQQGRKGGRKTAHIRQRHRQQGECPDWVRRKEVDRGYMAKIGRNGGLKTAANKKAAVRAIEAQNNEQQRKLRIKREQYENDVSSGKIEPFSMEAEALAFGECR